MAELAMHGTANAVYVGSSPTGDSNRKENSMYDEWLSTCSELELYTYIYSLGGALWKVRHDLADERYPSSPELEQWLVDTDKRIERGVDETTRLGHFAVARTNNGATESYWNWYYKMKDAFNSLSEKDQVEMYLRMPWNARKD